MTRSPIRRRPVFSFRLPFSASSVAAVAAISTLWWPTSARAAVSASFDDEVLLVSEGAFTEVPVGISGVGDGGATLSLSLEPIDGESDLLAFFPDGDWDAMHVETGTESVLISMQASDGVEPPALALLTVSADGFPLCEATVLVCNEAPEIVSFANSGTGAQISQLERVSAETGTPLGLSLRVFDAAAPDVASLAASVDWGDGTTAPVPLRADMRSGGFEATGTVSHVYSSSGNYRAVLSASDKDGASVSRVFYAAVTAAEPPPAPLPTVRFFADGNEIESLEIDEGPYGEGALVAAVLSMAFPTNAAMSVSAVGAGAEDSDSKWHVEGAPDALVAGEDSFEFVVCAIDGLDPPQIGHVAVFFGGEEIGRLPVTVRNIPPVFESIAATCSTNSLDGASKILVGERGSQVAVEAIARKVEWWYVQEGGRMCSVDWGDGTTSFAERDEGYDLDDDNRSASARWLSSHVYSILANLTAPTSFPVVVTVRDKDGGEVSRSFEVMFAEEIEENPIPPSRVPAIQWRNAYRGEYNRDFDLPLESYTLMGETNTIKALYKYGEYGEFGLSSQYLSLCQNRFDGWFFVSGDQAGEWRICQMYDDYMAIDFDGVRVVENTSWLNAEFAVWNAEPGWHRFSVIAGDTAGGYGILGGAGDYSAEIASMRSAINVSANGGEWMPFEDSVVFGDGTACAEGRYCTVSFISGECGSRTGGGSLSQIVRRGMAAEAPEITADFGWTFVGWSADFSAVTSNLAVFARYEPDGSVCAAIGGGDALQGAIDQAADGETLYVAPGVYSPIDSNGKSVTIIALGGPENTVINASLLWESGITNRCATLGSTTNAVLRGFSLVNGVAESGSGGGAYFGTLEDCVISNCTARWGGGAYYSNLKRCIVKNNTATWLGGGTYYGTTESTLIADNTTTNRCGGAYYGTHVNATITGNRAGFSPGGVMCGTIRNTISYANTASSGSSSYYNVTNTACEYSCVYPGQSGTGNISSNPKFLNASTGDYSLQSSSPCINKGWNFLPVAEKDVVGNPRNRDWRTDIGAYEFQNAFVNKGSRSIYVSVNTGADTLESGRGVSWNMPFKTIQAAIDTAFPGDCIVVTNGTYGTISTLNKAIRIESVNGADVTFIDGGNSTRCAVLGTSSSDKSTVLAGFTLSRGYAYRANGGGAIYGSLEDCVISNCRVYASSSTSYNGGGTYYSDAVRCRYTGNYISYSGYGGAAYYGTLSDCHFENNRAYYGGGTAYGTISNCVYSGNNATSYNGGGAYYGTLYDCDVKSNTASQNGGGTYGSTLYRCLVTGNKATSYYGGGVYSGTLHECVISNNTASALGGGVYSSTMYNCLVARNSTTGSSSSGGGVQGGTAYNCTICDNSAPYRGGMQGGSAYNCIIWGNTETRQTSDYANVSNTICHSSCTLPLQTTGERNISSDPLFADSEGGNYRLAADSPCVDAALNIQIAEAVDLDGNLRVSNRRMDMGAYELQRSAEYDGVPLTFYVNAEMGDDGNFGVSADAPVKSIGAVLERSVAGDEILVAPGVYSPINSYGVAVTVRSTDGPEVTIIDASPELNGGMTNRCATLGMTTSTALAGTRLVGFTLRNGIGVSLPTGTTGSYGGASFSGVLQDCVITNNRAATGGGAYYGRLVDCRVVRNTATGQGGGTSGSFLNRCLVAENEAMRGGGCADGACLNTIIARNRARMHGGGTYGSPYLFSSTITENFAESAGGGCYPYLRAFNSIIWGNSSSNGVDNYAGSIASTRCYGCCTTPFAPGEGNTAADPYLRLVSDGTYRLAEASPCLDTGYDLLTDMYGYAVAYFSPEDVIVDYLGNERPQGERLDIGAVEGCVEMLPAGPVERVVGADGVAAEGIEVTWPAASFAQNYLVYRGSSSSKDDAEVIDVVTETRYFDTNTVPSVTYWYFIQAQNMLGVSAMSEGDSGFRVPPLGIEPDELPEAEAGSDYTCTLIGEGGRTPYAWSFHPVSGYYMTRQSNSFSSQSGSSVGVSGDDTCASYDLPWTFTYYGKQYNTVWLNSNGTLNFDGSFTTYSASASTFSNRVMVAVMWRDLNTSSGGVYVSQPTADSVMFRWTGVYYGSSSSVNFSVTLHKDGRIVVSHGSGNANGGFVGVSSGDGDAVFESVSSSLSYANNYVFGPSTTMDWASFSENGQISGKPLEPATNMVYVTLTDDLGNTITETRSMRVYASTNLHPVVTGYAPNADRVVVPPDCDTMFAFDASDPDGAELTYTWLIDGVTNQVGSSSEFAYRPEETFGGEHTLSCIISDGYWFDTAQKTWTIVVPKWYVAPDGADGNAGSSFTTAFATLQTAVNSASAGDVVYVKTGMYSPVSTSNKSILMLAAKNAQPVIDGQHNSRCVYVGNGASYTNTVFKGFVIRNGNANGGNGGGSSGGTFENCVFEHCRAENASGGASYYADLYSCRLVDNSAANGGAAYGGRLFNCQLDENVGGTGGGANGATLYNCTVTRNVATTAGGVYGGNCYNSIVWGNTLRDTIRTSNAESVSMQYSCTTPAQSGTGNRSVDPLLSQSANGIFCLYSGSPCIDAGNAAYVFADGDLVGCDRISGTTVDMGATEKAITGNYVKVSTEGPGFASGSTTVAEGESVSVTARQLDLNHALVGFFRDGAQLDGVVSSGFEHSVAFVPTNDVTEVVAVFETRTFLVSPDGDDAFDGRTWEKAKKTLQSAVDAAITGDEIVVADGVYDPVVTDNKLISIRSLNGWTKTAIDGGGTNRCVLVGLDWSNYIPTETNTYFKGFTIRNGYANDSNGCGSGVSGGRFENCVLEGNRVNSNKYGGAAFRAFLCNCLVKNNSGGYGGAADSSSLWNCTVVSNMAVNSGGGIYNSHTRNSIIWDNICSAGNSYSNNYNSISATITYSCIGGGASGTGNVSADPRFVDAENGDYRLLDHSPCIDAASASYVTDGATDLLGNPRVAGAAPDMGCYEGGVELPLPETPQGFTADDARRIGFVRTMWTAADWAWSYVVERASDESFADAATIGTTESLFFDDTNAVPETIYWYRVRGVNPNGASDASVADPGSCLAEFVIQEPSLETATAGIPFAGALSATGGAGGYVWRTGADDYTIEGAAASYAPGDRSPVGVSGDDNCKVWPLPFDFPFYGRTFNKVWVSSNGTLNFDSSFTTYSPSLSTFQQRVMVAALWRDLDTGPSGVEVATNGTDSITFYWNDARYHSSSSPVNVSATLFRDGTIVCSYGSGNANGGFVGVSAGDGSRFRHIDLIGTAMANADDIVFRPQDLPAGLSLASDGAISGTPTEEGTFSFTAFVSDSLGNGTSRIVTITVENNPDMRRVDFALGEHGTRVGGGALVQGVLLGDSATAPVVRAASGWVFDGWNADFTAISDNLTVTAQWRPSKPAIRVIDVAAPVAVNAGDEVEISWALENWGNAAFNGTMAEEVRLVPAGGGASVTVASVSCSDQIARDGTVRRSASFALPKKGMEGEWIVRVVSALRPSVSLHATGVSAEAAAPLVVSAIPLPDLTVADVASTSDLLVPGGTVSVAYAVRNDGAADATGPWTDSIWLVSDATGDAVKLADIARAGTLAPGEVRAESAELAIPETVALAGAVRARVVADSADAVIEADDADNATVSERAVSLEQRLFVSAASASVSEANGSVRLTVKRSGPRGSALVVALAADPAGHLAIPETVTIPSGNASVNATARGIDNSTVEGPRDVSVTVSAEGFGDASAMVTVTDNETPHLYLSLSGATIREGETLSGSVRRELVTDAPLTVYLAGPATSRCSYPSSVTIPAGEESAAFEISVPDNTTSQREVSYALRASASGHVAATAPLSVEDDDIPGFTLELYPEIASEGAGPNAVYATLTRVDQSQIAKDVTVRLSQSPAGNLILPASIKVPKYTMAVRFAVGTVDNALDDGDREVEINGSVVIEDCGCDGQPSTGDAIRAVMTVIDDDGPALSLKADPATMKEGLHEAGFLILSHNSALTEDLEVALSFDVEGEIDIPATATIPAGVSSVRIPVRTLDDGVEDGAKLVSVYAEDATGVFAPASTWVQVSDQNLPDLMVFSVAVPASVVAMERFAVTFVVTNQGFMARSGAVPYAVHLVRGATGGAVTATTLQTSGSLTGGIGVDGVLAGEAVLTAPELPGDFRVIVEIDPDGTISELDSANNTTASQVFSVSAAYAAEVTADADAYLPGETITITGVATLAGGAPAALVPVDVYLLRDSYRKTLKATTGTDGSFSVTYTPSSGEMGHYRVGACYPGVGSTAVQDEFDVMGMKRTSTANVIWDYALGDSATRTVTLKNLSAAPLTGLAARFEGVPADCSLEFTLPDTIPGNGSVTLSMTAAAIGITEQTDYEKFRVYLETEEGVALDFPLYFHSQAQRAQLRATPTSINTTMTVGAERTIAVTIYNDGKGDSGPVAISTPSASWIRVANAEIENLASGESATASLVFTPPQNLTLNSPYSGTIVVSCQNGNSVTISFRIVPVSSETGGIRVDVTDTLTLTAESSPHVGGAFVSVVNPGTGAVVASGTTGPDGIFEGDGIPTGKYNISISAPQHSSANLTVAVSPGVVTRQAVFLDYNSVNYVWKVVPTEVEDQYTIELVADYETNVPVPAMQVHVPEEIPDLAEGESYVCGVEIENTGLIAIVDVKLALSGSIGNWTYEQISPDIQSLPPKSSQTIYVKFTNPQAEPEPARRRAFMAKAAPTRAPTEQDLATVAPCTIGMIATARALCGEEGVDLLMRSKNIRIAGHICDMAALLFQELGKVLERWGIGGGGDGSDPERNPNPGTHPQEPEIRDPIEVEMPDINCACLLTVLDKALGWIYDAMGLPTWIFDFVNSVNNMSEVDFHSPESVLDFLEQLEEALEAVEEALDSDEDYVDKAMGYLDDVLDIYEECKDYFGENEVAEYALQIRERMRQLTDLRANIERLINLCQQFLDWWRRNHGSQNPAKPRALVRAAKSGSAYPEELLELASDFLDSNNKFFEELSKDGIESLEEFLEAAKSEFQECSSGGNALAVCSKVRFKLSQSVTMTREAFEGTLTLENGQLTGSLSDVRLVPSITDADGNVCNDLFGVTDKDHSGFGGTSFLNGDLTLGTGEKGVASVLFVATQQAAPTVAKIYYFGGVLSYFDNIRGERISVNLVPVPLQVNPSPYLKFDYFVQRDVYADDPFTDDVVEASMPAELSVLIRNTGAGDAKNVTIQSMQPEIVENEKGLAVAFSLSNYGDIRSALNGRNAHLGALEDVYLGTISAGESSVAQWWLSSSIEGHFIGMNASVTHANTWGNPDTSLIDPEVGTHKLVRSVVADGDALPDFLTSEEGDLYGRPDTIYTAAGEVIEVYAGTLAATARPEGSPHLVGAEMALAVALTPARSGWNYAEVEIPGLFRYTISKIERADGSEVPLRNAWITDRTFRDGLTPLLVEKFHIVDEFASDDAASYTVTLLAKPTDGPEVVSFEGVSNGAVESAVRNSVTVVFSTAVDPASFTAADLSLLHQGAFVADLSALAIAPETGDETGTRFVVSGLAAVCPEPGRNELTVQCAGIANLSGSFGEAGRSVAWTYSAAEAPYIIGIDGVPRRAVQSLDTVTVVLSTAVDLATFTRSALRLDGAAVGDGVSVRALDESGTRFAVEGLAAAQTADGEHVLSVDATGLRSLDGEAGVESFVATWTRDTVAPRLLSVEREELFGGVRFLVSFSEDVDESSITLDRFELSRSEATRTAGARSTTRLNAASPALLRGDSSLPATAALDNLGGGVWALTGLESAFGEDGVYTLSFLADGVADEAGNEAEGRGSVSWTHDTTPPDPMLGLRISPDLGASDADGFTSEANVTVLGTLPDDAATVEISVRHSTGGAGTVLVPAFAPGGTALASAVTLPGTGNMTLVVTCADEAGNTAETTFALYLDPLALTATLSGVPEDPTDVADAITLAFSDAVDGATVALSDFALYRDGAEVALAGAVLAAGNNGGLETASPLTFTLAGLDALCGEDGLYRLVFDGSRVEKALTGRRMDAGAAVLETSWTRYAPDVVAPFVTSVAIDGGERAGEFFDAVSAIDIAFSEPVNVPELLAGGWIGQAVKLLGVDDDGGVESVLLPEPGEIAWNEATATLRWTLPDGLVGPGSWRVSLDAGFLADAAGNALSADGADATVAGLVRFETDAAVAVSVASYAMPSFGDFDGDGDNDLLVGEKSGDGLGRVRLFRNTGLTGEGRPVFATAGTLAAGGAEIAIAAQGCQGASAALLPRSGVADLVVGDAFGNVFLHPAENNGWGAGQVLFAGDDEAFGSPRAVVSASDILGSGRASLVFGGLDGKFRRAVGMIRPNAATPPRLAWLEDFDGEPLRVSAGRGAPAAFDLNGDAIPDLVSGDTAGNVWAFLGDGRLSWQNEPILLVGAGSLPDRSRVAVADFSGTGAPTLAVGRSDGSVRLHSGSATPSPAFDFTVLRTPPTLPAALDAPSLVWATGGASPWIGAWTDPGVGSRGGHAARPEADGPAADGAWLETSFEGAGRISFRVRVPAGGSLAFAIDGSVMETFPARAGEAWADAAFTLSSGMHEARWTWTAGDAADASAPLLDAVAWEPAPWTDSAAAVAAETEFREFLEANGLLETGADEAAFVNASLSDDDGDGQNAWAEFVAMTDPTDPDDRLVADIAIGDDGVPVVTWDPDRSGERDYVIEGADELAGPYAPVDSAGEDGAAPSRFYRVKVLLP